jgi:2-oxoglutarate ferredoxin oxidoreductase subunit gamma
MPRNEIKLSGVGGQGIVSAGTIIGCAASVYDGKKAVQTKEYGSELRGGDVSTGIIVSDEKIIFPSVIYPNVLVLLAQQAYTANSHYLAKDKLILITDDELVSPDPSLMHEGIASFSAPFNELADKKLGQKSALNIIMLGFFSEITGIVSAEALRRALLGLLPPKNLDANLKAIEIGIEYGGKFHVRDK